MRPIPPPLLSLVKTHPGPETSGYTRSGYRRPSRVGACTRWNQRTDSCAMFRLLVFILTFGARAAGAVFLARTDLLIEILARCL